jgi:hypothetical protein
MKRMILAISAASIMMGCSTAYRSGQTPDDVYFSPVNESRGGYVDVEEERNYRDSEIPLNDRYLRMKAMGGSRWRAFDNDFAYWNNPYWNNSAYLDFYPSYKSGLNWGGGFGVGVGNPFFGPTNFGYNPFFNPFSPYNYGRPIVVFNNVKYTNPRANGPRIYNMNNYTPPQNSGSKFGSNSLRSGGQYINNGGNGTPRGGYNPRGSGNSNSSPSRTFSNNGSGSGNNNSSNSSSSGSSSSGSAPVRSFGRGGN